MDTLSHRYLNAIEDELKKREIHQCSELLIVKNLEALYRYDIGMYYASLNRLPDDILAYVLLKTPAHMLKDSVRRLPLKRIITALGHIKGKTSDALMRKISTVNPVYANTLKVYLSKEQGQEKATHYDEDEIGSYMDSEFITAYESDTVAMVKEFVKEFRKYKSALPILRLYVLDDAGHYKNALHFTDLFVCRDEQSIKEVLKELKQKKPITVLPSAPVSEVVKLFRNYDLSAVAVVDKKGFLKGRIVFDDIYTIMQESELNMAAKMSGVEEEIEEQGMFSAARKRIVWLFVNMAAILMASVVIGMFEKTIEAYVALAVLMPVVASLGGNAGMQALTVTIRKIAMGEVEFGDTWKVLVFESSIVAFNGVVIAALIGVIAYVWFGDPKLSYVISSAMFLTVLLAGAIAAVIPMLLKRIGIDPALASSIFLTSTIDMAGFFIFLSLAELVLITELPTP